MEWTRGPVLGRGSSATVSLATTSTGDLFAVKSTHISSSPLLQKEQNLISELSSPYIIKSLGSDVTGTYYNLFLEYIPGGTLSDLIKSQNGSLKETTIQFYSRQILQGLEYLHLNGVVHCDIKGQNMLVSESGLKIADFGCAKKVCSASSSGFAGTPAYMAPEVARGEEQSFPADVWALGCTVIEMATGSNPWPDMKDPASALYRIGYCNEVPVIPNWFSGNAKDFVAKCLIKDPTERLTVGELLKHPFVKSVQEEVMEELSFTRKSPTSVMDQDFWDAFEVSSSTRSPIVTGSSSDSPASRIGRLMGELNSSFSGWAEEEDWVTVRGNEVVVEHSSEVAAAEQNIDVDEVDEEEDMVVEEAAVGGSISEEIQTSTLIEDSLFGRYYSYSSYSDEIGIVQEQSNEEDHIDLLSDSIIEDISVSRLKDFTIKLLLMKLFLESSSTFVGLSFCLFCSFSADYSWHTRQCSSLNHYSNSFPFLPVVLEFSKFCYCCNPLHIVCADVFCLTPKRTNLL